MAHIRTARVLAAAAALPLAALLFAGVADANSASGAARGANAGAADISGSGVSGVNTGNSTTTQQVANGPGASNDSSSASAVGWGNTIDQSKYPTVFNFSSLW